MIGKIIIRKQSLKCIRIMLICITVIIPFHECPASIEPLATQITLQAKHSKEMIVLVHGLMRTSLSMWPLKKYLERQGYRTYYYSYPSARYSIQQHGIYFRQYIQKLSQENPGIKIHFITHSMGGILVREALAQSTSKELKSVGSLIMLAPPNQGSKLAALSVKVFPVIKSFIKPLAELSSDKNAYVHQVPVPKIKVGIIAGKYDAKVPPESARLKGQIAPVIVNSTHTFIMNNAKTKQLIVHFLEKGSFS